MNSSQAAFDRYEEIRPRLPNIPNRSVARSITSLLDIRDHADAFVFDAFGVLNVGNTLIPGADRRLEQLRRSGCAIRVLSNAASYGKAHTVRKFHNLGLSLKDNEIVTSRDAIFPHLDNRLWGLIAADDDAALDFTVPTARLNDDASAYDRSGGIVFLSTANWSEKRQSLLEASLLANPRPLIIANADIVAPRGNHLSLEPGYYGHRLVDLGHHMAKFFGKPFPDVYRLVARTLPGIPPERIIMCGDSPHTDILGAAAQGWKSVLVTRDGLFAGQDTNALNHNCGIHANWQLERI